MPGFPPPDYAEDIGDDHSITWFGWYPDRDLNPQYANAADIPNMGVVVYHHRPGGEWCSGAIHFDRPEIRELIGDRPVWQVMSMNPLHVEPSVLCKLCGDHGYIRDGRWVPA